MTRFAAEIVFVVCVVAWCAIRYPHYRRKRRVEVRTDVHGWRDNIPLAIAATGLGILPMLYCATNVLNRFDYPFIPALAGLGTAIFAGVLILFYRTHRDLGRNWTIMLHIHDKHTLVTGGVYSLVRHPMYSGFFLWGVAQALLLQNWIAGPAGLIGFGILYFLRVGKEERLMLDAFGEEYRAYMQKSWRLIPWVY